jgi:hypothetical protein
VGVNTIRADVAIIGGGLGGCAAALAAARLGYRVVLTEDTRWIGGQLTSQAIPPDEHPWIEAYGSTRSYRELRNRIREYYRLHLPLTEASRKITSLNPGNGFVSKLCHDPRVALAVLHEMLAPFLISGRATVLPRHCFMTACTDKDRIVGVTVKSSELETEHLIEAPFYIDATPLGDLLAGAGAEHVIGADSRVQTAEPHAPDRPDPLDQQAITFCFAMEYLPGEEHNIDKPAEYEYWRDYRPPNWPGRLLSWNVVRPWTLEPLTRSLFEEAEGYSWWTFRRTLDRENFIDGFAASDVTAVDWPQNDYRAGAICGVDGQQQAKHTEAAKQLSLSLLYWLQTEAPRPDGGQGYPGLRLRGDVVGGTPDGLAMAPYIRTSRRIRAEFTVLEQHIGYPLRPHGPEIFPDSVGVGCYRIDLHPRVNGEGYLDLGCWPFQIPLGSLIPIRVENLIPGGKNLGTTHITNGAYRVHHVEWNVGESAGLLAAFCLEHEVLPRFVRSRAPLLAGFQSLLTNCGVELSWPSLRPV